MRRIRAREGILAVVGVLAAAIFLLGLAFDSPFARTWPAGDNKRNLQP